jgi:hypothetical protein
MSKWISVEDALPEFGVEVLAYYGGTCCVTIHTGEEWDEWGGITHWMDLPNDPEEE